MVPGSSRFGRWGLSGPSQGRCRPGLAGPTIQCRSAPLRRAVQVTAQLQLPLRRWIRRHRSPVHSAVWSTVTPHAARTLALQANRTTELQLPEALPDDCPGPSRLRSEHTLCGYEASVMPPDRHLCCPDAARRRVPSQPGGLQEPQGRRKLTAAELSKPTCRVLPRVRPGTSWNSLRWTTPCVRFGTIPWAAVHHAPRGSSRTSRFARTASRSRGSARSATSTASLHAGSKRSRV